MDRKIKIILAIVDIGVAAIPVLAKVSYYLILIVCYPAIIGWFNFGLIQIGKGEEKIDTESRKTIAIMIGMLLFFLVVITWLITIICAYQCKNQ